MATITGTDSADNLPRVGDPDTSGADTFNGLGGNDSITGGGGNDTMNGGTGNDTFYIGGTSFGTDYFNGGEGDDQIFLTNDVTVSSLLLDRTHTVGTETLNFYTHDIAGTSGNDIFNFGGILSFVSASWIYMQDGDDSYVGHAGSDSVSGGSGNDTLNGSSGNDELTGGSGNDRLIGGTGNDRFYIGGTDFGQDVYQGGDGTDEIFLTGDITVSQLTLTSATVAGTENLNFYTYDIAGTTGNDVFNVSGILSFVSASWIYMQDGADRYVGHDGSDSVHGGSGNDTLDGGAGNDQLQGSSGNDRLIGGSGNDTFYIGGTDFGQDVYLGGDGTDEIFLTGDITVSRLMLTKATAAGTENLNFYTYDIAGTTGNDVFNVSGILSFVSASWIYMQDGADHYIGHDGSDSVHGGTGNDTLDGGAGNDQLQGSSGDDRLNGGSGNDIFYIGGNDFGTDVYLGGTGTDEIQMIADVTVSQLDLSASKVIGTETLNMYVYDIIGTTDADVFDISGIRTVSSYSTITMLDGNDLFRGHLGNDDVDTGAGNDTLIGGGGDDRLTGGAGRDTVDYSGATGGIRVELRQTSAQVIGGGQGTDTLSQIEHVIGSARGDRIGGNAGVNQLLGGGGNDTLAGAGGNDVLSGGVGVDTVDYSLASGGVTVLLSRTIAQNIGGGHGSDRLISIENAIGTRFADRLDGSTAANALSGGAGNDRLSGFGGNDLLRGQAGNDVLAGGLGADRFEFDVNSGVDRITDWQNGSDEIVIRAGAWQGQRVDDFGDLDINQVGGNSVVSFGNSSVTLIGVNAGTLDASDFTFI